MKRIYTTLVALLAIGQLSHAQTLTSTSAAPNPNDNPSVCLFYDATGDVAAWYSWHPGVDWKPFNLYAKTFSFYSYQTRLGIHQDIFANVGIGTTSPGVKLDLQGDIGKFDHGRLQGLGIYSTPAYGASVAMALSLVNKVAASRDGIGKIQRNILSVVTALTLIWQMGRET